MPSLFDPVATELGFRKFFGVMLVGTTLTLLYIVYSSKSNYPLSEILPDILNWWEESTSTNKALGLLGACMLYIGIVFYATLTVYEYLISKNKSERVAKK